MALSVQRASTSQYSSAESVPQWKHHVFLSFRGADTREGFISHLYHERQNVQGIQTFKDDKELKRGTTISPKLSRAIEESHLAIVVLSPNYASSTWCLDELTKILQCMEGRNAILPIFFHVDPSDVRNQSGSFAEAFAKHEEKFRQDLEKVNQWRAALRKLANLSGCDSKNYSCERELIEHIVDFVWSEVRCTFTLLEPTQKFVGIDSRVKKLNLFLATKANDVRVIGIWGMGGIGKTTIAKEVYERISHTFEVSSFLLNVRDSTSKSGLVHLQKQLLSQILKKQNIEIWDVDVGRNTIQRCLSKKKVLLILDDVDQLNQLEILVGKKEWFGLGSRIIITTRNERLLIEYGIDISYKVEGLNDGEALELFCLNAFRKDQPNEDFLKMAKSFLNHAKGLPLSLKILGHSLYNRDQDEWISALDQIKKSLDSKVFEALKISYDGLNKMEKMIFLDVACFHKGKYEGKVIDILDRSRKISSRSGIHVLVEKSLFTIEKSSSLISTRKVEMHDLIQEMAWEIVSRESKEPGQRSRLWLRSDISHVLMSNTGTGAIEAIVLRLPELEEVCWSCEAFSNMHGLRIIEFNNLIISSGPQFLPYSLRIINWSWYPSKFFPPSFQSGSLTKLSLRHSKLIRLWDGTKDFPSLKYIDLAFSDKLSSTPDFTGLPNLEVLSLIGCSKLIEIHPSIAVLKRLKVLDFRDCKSIKSLPCQLQMDSLEFFSLEGCSKVKKIPEFVMQMTNLSRLFLSGTAIEKIPSSIEHLIGLTILGLDDCTSLLGLPSAICKLKSLKTLYMNRCSKLDKLLGKMECLEELHLEESVLKELLLVMKNLENLHLRGSVAKSSDRWSLLRLFGRKSHEPRGLVFSSLNHLRSLVKLDLSDWNLCEGAIPNDFGHCLSSLQRLYLCGNNFDTLPTSISCLSKLEYLGLERCERLQQLPDLPGNRRLYVNVNDCTSIKRLCDPSKLSRLADLYDFGFKTVNCFRLVEDEGWINTILSRIMKVAIWKSLQTVSLPLWDRKNIVCPGSEIPEWFNNQSVGDSLNVELPPQSCTNWLGIAFCVVFLDQEYLENPAALLGYDYLEIQLSSSPYWNLYTIGHIVSAHLWVFYFPREKCREQFLFETRYVSFKNGKAKTFTTCLNVKKCGARLVYKEDLEQIHRTLKIKKRTHEDRDEACPSGSAIFDDKESICKRQKEDS